MPDVILRKMAFLLFEYSLMAAWKKRAFEFIERVYYFHFRVIYQRPLYLNNSCQKGLELWRKSTLSTSHVYSAIVRCDQRRMGFSLEICSGLFVATGILFWKNENYKFL